MVPLLGVLASQLARGVNVRLIHAKEFWPVFREDFDKYPITVASLHRGRQSHGSGAGHEERGAPQFRGGHPDHGIRAGVPRHPAFRFRVDGPTLHLLRPQAILPGLHRVNTRCNLQSIRLRLCEASLFASRNARLLRCDRPPRQAISIYNL